MRLADIKNRIVDQDYDLDELVQLLEITQEEIFDRFPDRLRECAEKFGCYEEEEGE